MNNIKDECIIIGKKLVNDGIDRKELADKIAIEIGVTSKMVENVLGQDGLDELYNELG